MPAFLHVLELVWDLPLKTPITISTVLPLDQIKNNLFKYSTRLREASDTQPAELTLSLSPEGLCGRSQVGRCPVPGGGGGPGAGQGGLCRPGRARLYGCDPAGFSSFRSPSFPVAGICSSLALCYPLSSLPRCSEGMNLQGWLCFSGKQLRQDPLRNSARAAEFSGGRGAARLAACLASLPGTCHVEKVRGCFLSSPHLPQEQQLKFQFLFYYFFVSSDVLSVE